ncbi:ATP-binding protein [Streptomyces sp. NBC_00893]|uniref:ATP-binding protein n=1 Tax=Streptomyces sp. NBC_00893 TaxID=2975862 RepID=UPI00224DD717|nr:ATP-binding protein [Streptomyces sp. NBC_00893]MCX4851339.1 ATP-binding protein [Streptomyces sp. NBC_00893]
MVLPREPETAAEARRLVRVSLSAWGLDDVADPAELVISDFIANADRHARGPVVRVIVERPAGDRVYLGVVDRAPNGVPQQQEPDAGAVGGRGLMMVDALTDRWGLRPVGSRDPLLGQTRMGGAGGKGGRMSRRAAVADAARLRRRRG